MLNRILTGFTARIKSSKAKARIKPSSRQVVSTNQQGELLEDYDEGPVPSYPPFQHGIPAASVRQVIETQSQLIQQIKEQLGLGAREWDKVVYPMLVRYAEIVHLLPASEAHHHRGAGGLFRHGLEAGFWACRSAENKIFTKAKTPKERRGEGKRWEVAALTGGLTHDVGKTISDVSVTDREGLLEWNPHQPLAQWLAEHKVRRYFLHWNGEREHKRHESFSVLFMAHIIQGSTKAYLLSHPEVMDQLLRVVSGQGEDTEFGKVVLWADRQSVSRDLKHQRISPDEFAYGVPVEKYVLDALRSLIGTKEYQPNKPPYAICVTAEGVYLKWQEIVSAILGLLRQDDIRGVPSNPDTLARLLIERGLATGRPAPTKDAPDAYYLYHEMKPRAKGLVSIAKTETDKYLLIHDPDMVFPSTAMPQTMEVELTPLQGRGGHSPAEKDVGKAVEPEKPNWLQKAQAADEQEKTQADNSTLDDGVEPTGEDEEKSAKAGPQSPSSQMVAIVDGVQSHITFEDLLEGRLGAAPEKPKKSGSQAKTDDGSTPNTQAGASENVALGQVSEDAARPKDNAVSEPEKVPAKTEHGHAASSDQDDFDLSALITSQVAVAVDETSPAVDRGNEQVEIPEFLKTLPVQASEEDEDDSIVFEDVDSGTAEQGGGDETATQELTGPNESQKGRDNSAHITNQAPEPNERAPDEATASDAGESSVVKEATQAAATDHEVIERKPSDKTPSAQKAKQQPDRQVERTAKVLASTTATPEDLLAEADIRLIKKREQEERFQKKQKRKYEKATRSTTDQFDVDATLEAKKRGKPLTLEEIHSKKRKETELAKTIQRIGLYVPGIDDDEDAAVQSVAIDKQQIDITKLDAGLVAPRKEKVSIDAMLTDDSDSQKTAGGANRSKTAKSRAQIRTEGEAATVEAEDSEDTQGIKEQKGAHKETSQRNLAVATDGARSNTDIEAVFDDLPSSQEIIELHQRIQHDMLTKTRSHLPDVDVALIADSIIYSLVSREEPLGQSVYFNSAKRLLIRYPAALEAHLPSRPKSRDMARLAREMKQAALVSHIHGGRAQDGPVQRDPETGEMVLAFTIAINKMIQKLLEMVEVHAESGSSLPVLSRLTHKDSATFEVARKEIQSRIDRQSVDNDDKKAEPSKASLSEDDVMKPEGKDTVEALVNQLVTTKQGVAANKKNINIAVLKLITNQVMDGKGSLIEDLPIEERKGVISVQKAIVNRAAKAANHKYVTEITLAVHTRWVKQGMSEVGTNVEAISVKQGRFRVYLKGDH